MATTESVQYHGTSQANAPLLSFVVSGAGVPSAPTSVSLATNNGSYSATVVGFHVNAGPSIVVSYQIVRSGPPVNPPGGAPPNLQPPTLIIVTPTITDANGPVGFPDLNIPVNPIS